MGDDFSTAYIGSSYEDARKQYRGRGDNQVSAEDLQKWYENRSTNDPQDKKNYEKYKNLTEPHTRLYALHICKKECIRKSNQNVGGGSVSFIPGDAKGKNQYWRLPHFKRMAGSSHKTANDCSLQGICDANANYPNDDPDRENVTVTNPLVNNFLRLEIEKRNVEIKKSLIEIDYWPQRIPSDKHDDIINYLATHTNGRRLTGSSKIELSEKYQETQNGHQVITFTDNNIKDVKLSIRQFGKKNIRIYRCKTGDLSHEGPKIKGDFIEWRGHQRKTERIYKYDNNELLLLWIPDDDNQIGPWRERCSKEVGDLIEQMNTGRMGKNFFPFVAPDYGGFFILIGKRDRMEGSQLPFISRKCNIDKILFEIKKNMKSRGFPFYKFVLNTRNLEIIWLEQNSLIGSDDTGLDHTLKTNNGEIHIMVSSEGKNGHDENINWIDLMVENHIGERILAEKKLQIGKTGGRNASFSLRIKKKGEYRMYLKTSDNDIRVLNMFVEKDSTFENSIYCEGKIWKKMNGLKRDDMIIAEPKAHKNLCKKILENSFKENIKDYIDYDNKNWKKKQNRKGLMIEINRTIFQMYKNTEGYVDSGTWTSYTNKMYTAVETLNWPNLELSERLTVPKIGVLQVLSGDHYPEAIWEKDIIINWKWKTWEYEHLSEEIGGEMKGWRIIHSTKTFKQLKDGKRYSEIGIDYQTGFRFGYSEIKDESYLDSLLQKRGIEEEPIDFLEKLWGVIEDYPITNIKKNRRRMRYDPGKKLTDSGRTDAWSMYLAFPWHSEQAGAKNSANTWQELIFDGVGVDLDFDNQRGEDRRQLFLEVNYYDGKKFGAWDRLPAELYLGCLYQTNGEISEKRVLVGTTDGWNEDRKSNLKWINQEDSMIGTKKGSDLPNLIHLLYPKNSYSDTRYLEREILRAFRTIYENQNNNILSIKTFAGLDIPNWAIYYPSEDDDDSIIDIKIQGFLRYIEQSPNAMKESEENLKQIMINNLIQKFWWKGEFKSE